ncbi:MAG: sugar isomerase, partial [Erysipelotrichaceae bacterium]|nr:sugar isomerase [Erysipelotrichaceae bacterium]
ANQWFDRNKEALMATNTFTFYGGGPLYGVAIEAALKVMEVAKRNVAVGFEIDDGMHGPTMGYTPSNCVIALNDGGVNDGKCRSLALWAKEVMHNGYIFGANPIDESDLAFEGVSEDWRALEFAPAVQVLAYRLAVDKGVNLRDRSRHKEGQYFKTHS